MNRTMGEVAAYLYLVKPRTNCFKKMFGWVGRCWRGICAVNWLAVMVYGAGATMSALGIWKICDLAAAAGRMFWP